MISNASTDVFARRRARVFLVLSGLFLGTLAMLNVIGMTRFLDLGFAIPGTEWRISLPVAVGVLPYPLTFLCTDLICELYGRERANFLVWVGLALNMWVMFILWLGGVLPGSSVMDSEAFFRVRELAFGSVAASMIAYLLAQFVDVKLFHFWKRLTRGKYLWIRNNGSTLISQMIDTASVIVIAHYLTGAFELDPGQSVASQLGAIMAGSYAFKMAAALADTPVFYVCVSVLSRYLGVETQEDTEAFPG